MSDEETMDEQKERAGETEEALEVAEDVLDEEEIEEDALTEEEMDEVEEVEEEVAAEVGAVLVLGQSDFETREANRGADDPSDNTLMEPQFIHRYGEMLFVSDRGNHRVLVWNTLPEENGEPASIVLGQEDFSDSLENRGITTTLDEMTSGLGDENLEGFTISKPEEDTMSAPAGIWVVQGKLYVSDSGNHRVLRWNGLPSDDGEEPNLVMGQDNMDCGEANRRGLVGSGSLFFPFGMCSGDDNRIFIADKDNHRVMLWTKPPFNNGWNADVCLGQSSFDEREPNRGDFDQVTPESLSFPTGVFYHEESGKLFVVDQGNNRVLIWNKVPSENGVPADLVLGQRDFYSRDVNMGLGSSRANEASMFFPADVVYGRKGLFVSDSGNNRVLVWTEMPTENGQPADLVLGQKSFFDCKFNRWDNVSKSTLNDPYGMFLEEDPEDEDDPGKLWICDRGNSRVVVWEELPNPPGQDEEEEDLENLPPEVEDNELLMGYDEDFEDDDDFDDDEDEDDKALS